MPHDAKVFQSRAARALPNSMLGVWPENSAAIDMVVE
jgi:hypothetical protein